MIVGVDPVLQLRKLRDALFQQPLGFVFGINVSGVAGIMILETEVFSVIYQKRLDEFARCKFQDFPRMNCSKSRMKVYITREGVSEYWETRAAIGNEYSVGTNPIDVQRGLK